MRSLIDAHYSGRILLAEVNEAIFDVTPYFGNGNEFHMVLNFPLMQKAFFALVTENGKQLPDLICHSIDIPKSCCWANFLRNHDELILRFMEENDLNLMFCEYANNSRMLTHGGIRRRLAPLVGNNLAKLEVLYALIFSVPGSPVIYYGDEIGMGDNVYLDDRNGLRTPMQWNSDRNAGFSEADPEQLYLPLVSTPLYHYDIVNVENEQIAVGSLLGLVSKMIGVRKNHSALRKGSLECLRTDNTKVIAFARNNIEETILSCKN